MRSSRRNPVAESRESNCLLPGSRKAIAFVNDIIRPADSYARKDIAEGLDPE